MRGKIGRTLEFLDVLGTTAGTGKSTDKGEFGLSKGSWKNIAKFGAKRVFKAGKHMSKKGDTTTPAKMRTGRGDPKDARTMFGDEIYYPT
jgi:hypothetical protein|tara:strand:- start:126 stop:395 length:270 start_codon:yes stop_codon:yes gene_type:complete